MGNVPYFAIGFGIGLGFAVMTVVTKAGIYIPRPWHQFMPFAIMTVGLYIGQNLAPTYDVILYVVCVMIGALLAWGYQVISGIMYQAYLTRWGKEVPPAKDEPEQKTTAIKLDPGFTLLARPINQNNAETVAPPKINAEQQFARTLIDQRNHNFRIVMTEEYWIKEKRFDGTREEFVTMLDKWEHHGLSGRQGHQRKRVPLDWKKIRLVADGHMLPSPPPS